jgi:hypothetical protein
MILLGLVSIFVILKYVDRALLRESGTRPSPNEPECNQTEENSSTHNAA